MKILLINPGRERKAHSHQRMKGLFPPLNLGIVAACTPRGHQVEIGDEHISEVDLQADADLVGITVMTAFAPRAYQLAEAFRKRGIPVVLGGMHPSALPEEARAYADSIVIGEAEKIWAQLIKDAENGKLKPYYRSEHYPSLEGAPIPRRDFWRASDYYLPQTVQTTRGCPFSCDFCAVSNFFGKTYRLRPVSEVIQEVRGLPGKIIVFVDDNIVGNPRYAKELFTQLIPLKKYWISQGSLNMAGDEELLSLAAKSGCLGMFIGLESLSPECLKSVGKNVNLVNMKEAIKKIKKYGIAIEGAFVFGFDHDEESVFERTLNFAEDLRLEGAQFGVLTPFPGTRLYQTLEKANRIIDRDWSKYTVNRVVYQPLLMSAQRLQEGLDWAWQNFFSYRSILKRLGIFRNHTTLLWFFNLVSRNRVYNYLKNSDSPIAWQ